MSEDEWTKASLVDLNKSEDWEIQCSKEICHYRWSKGDGYACFHSEEKVCSYANCPLKVSVEPVVEPERDIWYPAIGEIVYDNFHKMERTVKQVHLECGCDMVWFDDEILTGVDLVNIRPLKVEPTDTQITPNTTKEEGE